MANPKSGGARKPVRRGAGFKRARSVAATKVNETMETSAPEPNLFDSGVTTRKTASAKASSAKGSKPVAAAKADQQSTDHLEHRIQVKSAGGIVDAITDTVTGISVKVAKLHTAAVVKALGIMLGVVTAPLPQATKDHAAPTPAAPPSPTPAVPAAPTRAAAKTRVARAQKAPAPAPAPAPVASAPEAAHAPTTTHASTGHSPQERPTPAKRGRPAKIKVGQESAKIPTVSGDDYPNEVRSETIPEIFLVKTRLAVNPMRPKEILGTPADFPEALHVIGYDAWSFGRKIGYLLVEHGVTLVAPDFQDKPSKHSNIPSSLYRIAAIAPKPSSVASTADHANA